jgi:hypothetical protein
MDEWWMNDRWMNGLLKVNDLWMDGEPMIDIF